MPTSPVSETKFSAVPEGRTAMSPEELQAAVNKQIQLAAKALGGTASNAESTKQTEPTAEVQQPESVIEVDVEDRKRYIRSLLAKEPFTKTYMLFGDTLKAVFRTRKSAENESINTQSQDALSRHRARLAVSLSSLGLMNSGSSSTVCLNELEDVAFSAVSAAFNEFELLCDELFRRANDPDFWTRTAGRS